MVRSPEIEAADAEIEALFPERTTQEQQQTLDVLAIADALLEGLPVNKPLSCVVHSTASGLRRRRPALCPICALAFVRRHHRTLMRFGLEVGDLI